MKSVFVGVALLGWRREGVFAENERMRKARPDRKELRRGSGKLER